MNIVANLFAPITKNRVAGTSDRAFDKIREESVHHRAGVARTSEATTAEADGVHSKIAAVLLNHDIGCELRHAKERVFALVDGHRFVDPVRMERMRLLKLPP